MNRDAQTDPELFQRARGGDFPAFETLVERYQARVFGLARRIVHNDHDAEDVTQLTFLSLVEHLEQYRGESSVAAWILRIATNHALKILRKRRGLPTVPLEVGDAEESFATLPHPEYIAQWRDNPEMLAQNAELRQLIEEHLHALDDRYRLVFILRDIEGLSVREAAQALELSEANVKVRLMRARLLLRERLTRALGDETTRVVPDHAHNGTE
ncbi:MAG: sigma-70 family RNA polymerase sigma factor [Gemmataceae bacterium]